MIELTDGDFVHCVWLADAKGMDFLACCYKHEGAWVVRYRFRYHSPNSKSPWDEHDQKNWYSVKVPAGEVTDAAGVAKLVGAMDYAFGTLPNFRRINVCGDQRALLEIMAKEDRMHVRIERLD